MAAHLTRRVSRSAVYPMQWMGLMRCCEMAVKRMDMLGASVRKMTTLIVKMDTVTMIGNRR